MNTVTGNRFPKWMNWLSGKSDMRDFILAARDGAATKWCHQDGKEMSEENIKYYCDIIDRMIDDGRIQLDLSMKDGRVALISVPGRV